MPANFREEELDFMSHPDKWPYSFGLPMVQRNKERQQIATGFLYQSSMQSPCPPPNPVIRMGNLFASKGRHLSDFPMKEYKSLEAIVDDGWEVD